MYTILSTSTTIGWLVLMIILLLIEIPTVGLTTIQGVVGAFIAMLLSMVGVPIVAQFIVFFYRYALLLYYTRPWALKHLNNKVTKTNKDKLIGQIIKVTETVDNINQTGSGNLTSSHGFSRGIPQISHKITSPAGLDIAVVFRVLPYRCSHTVCYLPARAWDDAGSHFSFL